MLTERQAQCLDFLSRWFATHPHAPSFTDIAKALNLSSKSGVSRLIVGLEERGFIRRLPGRSRALELVARDSSDPAARVADLERQLHTVEANLKAAERTLSDIERLIPNWRAFRDIAEAVEVTLHNLGYRPCPVREEF